jgi:hypothetical protein
MMTKLDRLKNRLASWRSNDMPQWLAVHAPRIIAELEQDIAALEERNG